MKIVIVDKSNPNQKVFYTPEGKWDHRIGKAKDFDYADARQVLRDLAPKNNLIEIQTYQ